MTSHNQQLFDKSQKVIPGGVNSPVRAFRSVGGTPLFLQRGQGAHVWDADGKRYTDYPSESSAIASSQTLRSSARP